MIIAVRDNPLPHHAEHFGNALVQIFVKMLEVLYGGTCLFGFMFYPFFRIHYKNKWNYPFSVGG